MGALLVIACAFTLRFAAVSIAQLDAPFDLLYETPSYATVEIIASGRNPYSPSIYGEPPFVLTMYTPAYHHLVAALPASEGNVFRTARLVSLGAMILAAMTLLFASGERRWWVGLVGVGLFFAMWAVSQWGAYVKNDSLALAFSALGVAAVHASRGRAWLLVLAALFCALAITSKQSFVAASLAGAVFLFLRDRRDFAVFAASGAAFGVGFVLFAMLHWGPGFWFSTLSATGQDISWSHALLVLSISGPKGLLAAVFCVAVGLAVLQWRRGGVQLLGRSPFFLYALFACLICVATVGKLGASANYLIEPWLALLMWTAFALRSADGKALERPAALAALLVLVSASAFDLATARDSDYSCFDARVDEERERVYADLRREVKALGMENPSVLSFFIWDVRRGLPIFGQSKTYQVTDHVNLNDTLLYKLLWESGALDVRALASAIERQSFDLIIRPKDLRPSMRGGRLLPIYQTLMTSMRSSYRHASSGQAHHYLVPREGGPEHPLRGVQGAGGGSSRNSQPGS